MKINTIIFDIGGVLVGYNWHNYLMKLFNDNEAIVRELEFALFQNGVWDEVDRGVWSEEELIAGFLKNAPELENEIRLFWNTAGNALWQFDFTKEWIQSLKDRGYRLLYLSNWSAHMRQQASMQLDFLPMLEGGVFSYEEKLIKPESAIYEAIINKYQLIPEECVFLDDNEANVIAAKGCGLHAVQVVNHEIAVEGLEALLKG